MADLNSKSPGGTGGTEAIHFETQPQALTQDEVKHGDEALKVIGIQRVEVTPEDDIRIRRKTDLHILLILVIAYFWQIYDKAVWGYGNVFGLSTDTHLHGSQYSLASSINAIAQLCWLPFSTYLIVRVPSRYLMTALIFGWGTAQACLPAAKNFGGLMACRFLLGLFEAACLPLYAILTSQWYRRSEQPLRVAAWYSNNGTATIVAALLSYGLGHVNSPHIAGWQLIYMVAGLLTVITAPFVYLLLDSDVMSARFLSDADKLIAVERLRANQTGTGVYVFKWKQIREMVLDLKTYLWFAISALLNVGASVTGAFGPTLIKNFGFNQFDTALLNIPFGVLQLVTIIGACYLVQKTRLKSPVLIAFMAPVLAGLGMLYSQGTSAHFSQATALAGYYMLGFLFGGNTLLVTWMIANTGGQTKKSGVMVVYNIASSVGNIVGPLLFSADQAPHYLPGIRAVLGIYCALVVAIVAQVLVLWRSNKTRQTQRVAHGKPRFIVDTSMSAKFQQYASEEDHVLGQNGVLDLTDCENDEFIYVY